MTRHTDNPNLNIYYDSTYLGLPVMVEKGPFIWEYLDRLYQTMFRAIHQYRRVFAFRCDLCLPAGHNAYNLSYENEIVDRFIESFKAKIRHNRQMALRENKYAHDTVVRYCWARELGERHGRPHYHFAFFLNFDAFRTLGKFSSERDNIFNRLQEAWASALGMPFDAAVGLVEIPTNPYIHIYRDDHESIAAFFHRASYLCKLATKTFGNGGHGFGASRT